MNALQWWSDTLGWDGTCQLLGILAAGVGIAACAWSLGRHHGRHEEQTRQRTLRWRGQKVIK